MNKIKLQQLRVIVDKMHELKSSGGDYESLRYEVIPGIMMPYIEFFLGCAEKVVNEQKELL